MPTTNTALSKIEELKQMDDTRAGFPGEHWIVLGLARLTSPSLRYGAHLGPDGWHRACWPRRQRPRRHRQAGALSAGGWRYPTLGARRCSAGKVSPRQRSAFGPDFWRGAP